MAYNDIRDFYRNLGPEGVSGDVRGNKTTDKKSLKSILSNLLLNPGGVFYSFDDIVKEVNNYYSGNSSTISEDKKDTGLLFHAIGSDSRLDLEDADYWGGDKIPNIKALMPDFSTDMKISAFVVKNPFISPATRGTQEIDFFLNYTPSILTSQLTPYFEVEFHIKRPVKSDNAYLDTPSIMRFLMGSENSANFSSNDRFLSNASRYSEKKGKDSSSVSVSGMEMFLMPQTLTNMESLNEQGLGKEAARLVPVRPFVPFASIEGFDVTIQNAGAGAFAHKKASLKLKIHDKSRLGEFSEFFRGEVGFSQAIIWTTYGWIAPRGSNDKNEYAKFINENMLVRECWKAINSQFSFDQSGQVSVNFELVSSAAKTTQGLTVCETDESIKNFHRTVQWIAELKKKITPADGKFSIGVTSEQVLNAASTNGVFKDIKDLDAAVSGLIASLRTSGYITEDDAKELDEKIKSISGNNSYENALQKSTLFVKEKFDKLARTDDRPDPFLPTETKKKYFPGDKGSELITEINRFISDPDQRNKAVEQTKKKLVSGTSKSAIDSISSTYGPKLKDPSTKSSFDSAIKNAKSLGNINLLAKSLTNLQKSAKNADDTQTLKAAAADARKKAAANKKSSSSTADKKLVSEDTGANVTGDIKLNADIVSFGKLFTSFVVPSIASTLNVDELQLYFYGLNDTCGPMSGMSIAEFPVNVRELVRAYNEAIKAGAVDTLELPAFLKLVIETQINNKSSIAYGMNRFYNQVVKDGKVVNEIDEKDADTRDGLEKWVEKYGPLKFPVIEMYIETADRGAIGKDVIGSLKKSVYRTSQTSGSDNLGKDRDVIMKIHIYDRSNNPHKLVQKVVNSGNGLEIGDVDSGQLKSFIEELKKTYTNDQINDITQKLQNSELNYKEALKNAGIPEDTINKFSLVNRGGLDELAIPRDRKKFKEFLIKSVPSIVLGTNGSLVLSANVASKTDGTMGAINLMNARKSDGPGKAGLSSNGIQESNGLPLRVVPVQVTMTTMGVPTAQLYQTYFIDFNTGTSIDNLYNCSQLQHSISQGKFTTNWTFIYVDGYGKFGAPKSINEIITGQLRTVNAKVQEAQPTKPPDTPPKPGSKKKSAQTSKNTRPKPPQK